jgi:hypothetical protein
VNEVMTLDEVDQRFDSEWVLFGDPEEDEHHRVIRGRVLFHSKDRDEMYRKMLELRPKRAATHFTGSIPEGTEVVL